MPNLRKKEVAKKMHRRVVSLAILIVVILSLFNIIIFFYSVRLNGNGGVEVATLMPENFLPAFLSTENITIVSMKVPAVDNKGNGLATWLLVEAMPGSGRTLVDIDNLLFWADTQQSIRTARRVAANITGLDVNKYDLVYSIYANATVIGGESAGVAITIATIAALEKKKLNESIMITGSINHDGSIGPVSETVAKAKAAKQAGAELFLVPLMQSHDVLYETSQHCERFGPTEVCSVEQVPKTIVVSEEAGISVVEVGSVTAAMKYYIIE